MFEKRRTHTTKILLAVAIIGVSIWIYSRPHTENLADFIPEQQTVIYAELPTQMNQLAVNVIKEKTGIDLNITGFSELASSATLIRLKEEAKPTSHTFVSIQPTNDENLKKITDFFAATKVIAGYVTISKSSKPIIIAAQNQQDFQYASALFSPESTTKKEEALSKFTTFQNAKKQHRDYPYFVFAQPRIDQSFFILPIQEQTSTLPILNMIADSVEAHFDVHDDGIKGELISTNDGVQNIQNADYSKKTTDSPEQSYRALTLSLLPIDPEVFVGGTSLSNILSQTIGANSILMQSIVAQYLPGISYENEIAPLIKGEFGFVTARRQNYTGALLVINIDVPVADSNEQLKKIMDSFAVGAAQLAFSTQPFILRDGTQASERIPDEKGVTTNTEKIGDDTIYSVNYGQYDEATSEGIFAAITHGKLLLSNDKQLISQAISRANEPGLNFRDGDLYSLGLQPLLKNPQLTGLMHLEIDKSMKGLFSFSKRKFSDYTETQFQFMLE